jgi:hypothetical protein
VIFKEDLEFLFGKRPFDIVTPEVEKPIVTTPTLETTEPTIEEKKILNLRSLVAKRVQKVMLNVVPLKWHERLFLRVGINVLLKRKISKSIIQTLLELLEKHQLIETKTT